VPLLLPWCSFFGFHLHLVCTGKTTIEVHDPNRANPYDRGVRRNWNAVFGENPLLWFLPIDTVKDTGYDFDVSNQETRLLPKAAPRSIESQQLQSVAETTHRSDIRQEETTPNPLSNLGRILDGDLSQTGGKSDSDFLDTDDDPNMTLIPHTVL